MDILMVSTEQALLDAVAKVAGSLGHRVVLARDDGEVLEKARARRPDVIVADSGMLNGSGAELMRRLRLEGMDRKRIRMISRQHRRMSELVESILEAACLEAQREWQHRARSGALCFC